MFFYKIDSFSLDAAFYVLKVLLKFLNIISIML